MAADWDPDQYRRFVEQRSAPFWDLVDLVRPPVARMVDLGCGDGELTVGATERLGATSVLGIDSSPAMLERAAERRRDGVSFTAADIGTWTSDGDVDLVLANASLQWVPDHPAVLARWVAALAPGGQLAVQVPANGDHPAHTVAQAVAESAPFADAFDGGPPPDPTAANVLDPAAYSAILHELGCAEQHVRLQVYGMALPDTAQVVEWIKGTNLTRIFKRLPDELHEPYLDAYRSALVEAVGDRSPFWYPFKRILMWGRTP